MLDLNGRAPRSARRSGQTASPGRRGPAAGPARSSHG
jgi:hypothetical protein